MTSTFRILTVAAAVLLAQIACAQDRPKTLEEAETLAASLQYQTGEVTLRNGIATVRVPEGMRFLNGGDASKVLVNLWGNPPSDEPLGMLMPELSPLNPESWAIIISFSDDGYCEG